MAALEPTVSADGGVIDSLSSVAPNQLSKKPLASCKRCRARKIKCDDTLGGCGPCRKAGVECIEVTRTGQNAPRSVTVELAERIIWLEGIIKERCADVDLSVGPGQGLAALEAIENARTGHLLQDRFEKPRSLPQFANPNPIPLHGATFTPSSISTAVSSISGKRARVNSFDPTSSMSFTSFDDITHSSSVSTPSEHEDISHEVGLVSLAGLSDARYVGPSSGFSFAKLVRAALQFNLTRPIPDNAFASSAALTPLQSKRELEARGSSVLRLAQLHRRLEEHGIPLDTFHMPHLAEAAILIDVFFSDVHFQFPCLHQSTFSIEFEHVYSDQIIKSPSDSLQFEDHCMLFRTLLVMAIGLRAAPDRSAFNVSPVALFDRALAHLEPIMSGGSTLDQTQCLILVAIYSLYSPAGPNTWTLAYHLMANCVDLGLQRRLQHLEQKSAIESDLRKRLFWTIYSLDRILSCALGRPLSLRDEAFDVSVPANLEESEITQDNSSMNWADNGRITTMTPSIRLFELYQIFAEIKLNIYRVRREPDRFPWPSDLELFRRTTLQNLNTWRSLAQISSSRTLVRALLDIRYHQAILLLFRPSPAFPIASPEALAYCHSSAKEIIHILDRLQRQGRIPCTYLFVHETLLSGLTILFCQLILPVNVGGGVSGGHFSDLSEIRSCSSVLAALGEVWVEARKARNVFDKLSDMVISVRSAKEEAQSTTVVDHHSEESFLASRSKSDELSWLMDSETLGKDSFGWDVELGLETSGDSSISSAAVDSVWNLSTNSALQELLDSLNVQFSEAVDRVPQVMH